MYQTKNSLSEKVRVQVIGLLQERLADSIDLYAQLKHAHWNVKGPDFIALHKLFDEVGEESEQYADLIAERIVQLGGIAEGNLSTVTRRSGMPAYPVLVTSAKEHIAALAQTLGVYGDLMRKGVNMANEVQDPGTADILTEVLRGADKNLWFIEAQNQAER